MKATNVVILGGLVSGAGSFKKNDRIPGRELVGFAVFAIFIAVIAEFSESLATAFAALYVIQALLRYGPELFGGFA